MTGALAFAALLAAVPAPAPVPIASAAARALQSGAASALSVAVVNNGRIVYERTFGAADRDTAFSIGSVSKIFTAVSIMQLVQRGSVALDAPASTYLPQYPALERVTVRELLDHTGGVPNILDDALATGDVLKPTTPGAMLAKALARPPDFPPGTDWNYSNTGYVALGQIVEHVSGMPLATYEQRNIFDPAGMRHSYVAPALGKDAAAPFHGTPGDWSWYYAAGDVFASAADLANFDIALMRGQLLLPSTFAQMRRTVPFATLAPGMHDALGLFVTQIGNVELTGHHGGEPGFRADNEMIPERGFAAIVLGSGNYDTQPLLRAAIETFVPGARLAGEPAQATGEDPAVTARFTAFLRGLQQGRMDASQVEILTQIQLPSPGTIAKQLAPYGALQSVQFESKAYISAGKYYVYKAAFAKGDIFFAFVIDRDGKFASFTMQPVNSPK